MLNQDQTKYLNQQRTSILFEIMYIINIKNGLLTLSKDRRTEI